MKRLRIPNVPVNLYKAVLREARLHHRSVSEEVLAIIEQDFQWRKLGIERPAKPKHKRR